MAAQWTGETWAEQVDWEYTDQREDNSSKCIVNYEGKASERAGNMPALGSVCPYYEFMFLEERKVARLPGDRERLTLTYESPDQNEDSGNDGDDEPVTRYGGEITVAEVPLLAAKRYEGLSDTEKKALAAIINGNEENEIGESNEAKVTSDEGLEALGLIREGQSHYEERRIVWFQRFTTKDLEECEADKVGYAYAGGPPGPIPATFTPAGYEWLYLGTPINPLDDGESWELEKRWERSGPKGLSVIYDEEEEA